MRHTPAPVELALRPQPSGLTLSSWLYDELRRAILDGRLRPGTQLPSTRTFAGQHGVSRGTVVSVFEQLHAEGYVTSRVGSGTRVSARLPDDLLEASPLPQGVLAPRSPVVKTNSLFQRPARPFRPIEPALTEFPIDLWARIAARRLRRLSVALLAGGGIGGYGPLREAIAGYLGASRAVRCTPDQVIVVSGVQQALDLVARVIARAGDRVWIEDPGYTGAARAFLRAGATLIPVPVDANGFDPALATARCAAPRAVYVTPAHQFVLGATMPLERRLDLLAAARAANAVVIEDDYDSEFRYTGRPVPSLQGLDRSGSVIFLGSFNKVLFPSLRLGYMVVPPSMADLFLATRYEADRYPPGAAQAILCDFIVEGHFGRHLRRMRSLYAERLDALHEHARRYLDGALEIPRIAAGLHTASRLTNGMSSQQAHQLATGAGVETMPLDQFALERRDLNGLLLGFAAFTPREIKRGVVTLASALEGATAARRRALTR